MSYEVLALKYRPKVFEDLVGQDAVTRTLTNAIQQGRIANAFLFSGVRGVGKTTTARILAKALNCDRGPTVRPCGECAPCKEITRGSSLDVLEIDGATHTKVEEFRELLESMQYTPSRDRYKIYIVDEVHMLSNHSFNALLKTLEEPPPHVKFIFATTESHKILDTILSRCQEFEFRTVSPHQIADQLLKIAKAEAIEVSDGAIRTLARAAAGSLRDGISALDQVIAASDRNIEEQDVTELLGLIERDVLRQTTHAVVAKDTAAILKRVDELVRGGRDLRYFTSALMQYLRDVLVAKVAPDDSELIDLPDEISDLRKLADELSEEDLLRALDVLTQTETTLRTSSEPRFHVEMALLKLSQLGRVAPFEELVERFEVFVSGGAPSKTPAGSTSKRASKPRSIVKQREARSNEVPSADRTEETTPAEAIREAPRDSAGFVSKLVEQLKTGKPMLHALVSRCETAMLDGDRLTLTYLAEQKVLAEQLQQKALKDLLEEQASGLATRKLSVSIEILDKDVQESPPAAELVEAESESLRERADRDPLVRQFIDTFQGEIESVKKPESDS